MKHSDIEQCSTRVMMCNRYKGHVVCTIRYHRLQGKGDREKPELLDERRVDAPQDLLRLARWPCDVDAVAREVLVDLFREDGQRCGEHGWQLLVVRVVLLVSGEHGENAVCRECIDVRAGNKMGATQNTHQQGSNQVYSRITHSMMGWTSSPYVVSAANSIPIDCE